MFNSTWSKAIYKTDELPPTSVPLKVKQSKEWQRAMLDSLEHIAKKQFIENLKYDDFYRMLDNRMSYQELKDVIPHLEGLQDLLSGADLDIFLKHYDILGSIIRDIVGRYRDFQDKFFIRDLGDVAENEYQQHKMQEIIKEIDEQIKNVVDQYMIENGRMPDGQKFESPEQQQQFMQQLQQEAQKNVNPHLEKTKDRSYKSMGVQWAEVTLKDDQERMGMYSMDTKNLTDYLLTGRAFRHFVITPNEYKPEPWSPKNTFFSKEVDSRFVQDGEYVGRLHIETPAGVIKRYGHIIDTKTQKEILGGRESWKNFVAAGFAAAPSPQEMLRKNHVKPMQVPFANYLDYNYYLSLQDETGIAMGEYTSFNPDGSQTTRDTYLPRYNNITSSSAKFYANILRSDFQHRNDLCEIVEAYVRCYDLYGLLTYEDDNGDLVTEWVTEEILPELIKEKGIKQIKNQNLVDIIAKAPEVDTIVWLYRPVIYEGVKILCPNIQEPLYLYFKPCDHQIKGAHMYDVKIPVSGYIGKGVAERIMPYQMAYNLCMNQMVNMLEKEIGIFFLMDVGLIPSDVPGYGDSAQALGHMRDIIKDLGMAPVQTSGDADKNQNTFNQFSTYNLSYQQQVEYRLRLSDRYKQLAYEQVGSNPQLAVQPSKYETAEGIRVGQEVSIAQLSEVYDEFSQYKQRTLEMHLSVAQYCQSDKIDITVPYTRDNGTVEYLRFTDPSLPFRTLALTPSYDNNKKREHELYKQWLMNNTNQIGPVEVARLLYSDSMTEAIEIGLIAQREREAMEQQTRQQQGELLQQDAQLKEEAAAREHERNIELERIKAESRISAAQQHALGRTTDRDDPQVSINEIKDAGELAIKRLGVETKARIEESKLERQKTTDETEREFRMKELALKAEEIKNKLRIAEIGKETALVNKN
jgi:hypothetical protein